MSRIDVIQLLKDKLAGERSELFDAAGGPVRMASAPGRLDVLGGMGAQAGGTVAQMALPVRIGVAVQFSPRPALIVQSDQIAPPIGISRVEIPLDQPANLAAQTAKSWAAPVLALWQVFHEAHPPADYRGATILIHGDVPMSAGQASSTALLAALITALASLRGILDTLDPTILAEYVQRAEELCGNTGRVGRTLDAMTCLVAETGRPRIFRYSTQPFELVGQALLPADLRILAMDTGVRYTSARETLDELHVASAMGLKIVETIYRDLGQTRTPLHGYLANTSPLLYRQYFRALLPRRMRGSDFVRTFGAIEEGDGASLDPAKIYRVRTAVDHLIAENEHAEQFLQAIEELTEENGLATRDAEERQRTMQRAGRLVLASHHSYRLRLELSCREADWLVDRLMDAGPDKGIFGARITGCGGGGTVMALTDRSSEAGDIVLEMMRGYHKLTGLSLSVVEASAPGSAGSLIAST